MIGDARSVVRGTTIEADICIVGAGAAGITVALELLGSGMRIVLLEAGGTTEDPEDQALYEGEVADPLLHSPPDKYRQRRFGGSTTIWGGRCVPLDVVDFEHRPWIPDSGWPVSHQEVAAYYPRANAVCEAGDCVYDAEGAVPGGMRSVLRDFSPADFTTGRIERFSCPTDFGRRYRDRLAAAPDVRVLLHANCTRLLASADGARIEQATIETLDGNRFSVVATRFILATGALEAARLLLASRDVHAAGIGNARGLVGRYYMCHIAGTIGTLRIDSPTEHVWQGYDRAEDGVYCRRRIALTEAAQRREAIGNAVFRLHHPRIPDPRTPHGCTVGHLSGPAIHQLRIWQAARNAAASRCAGMVAARCECRVSMFSVLRGSCGIGCATACWRNGSSPQSSSVHARICSASISMPSRCRTGTATSGLPSRPIGLACHGCILTGATRSWMCERSPPRFGLLQRDLAQSALGELTLDPDEADIETVIRRDGAYGGHHIGTARMAHEPAQGVVDEDCRVFGVHNLYVAGSAVFPTSGQANPTLTIVALAIRLAHHIEAEASRPAVILRQSPALGAAHSNAHVPQPVLAG